ncbi:hypothetical protein [Mycobacterium europaeum]|uniref:hypothetical protein n=1 Tax=Mycobacterium europaeum TaxID=761804 RepID=UPI001146B427|nr:hypothetical protein [Mycobacterium europaeum]
MNKTFTVAVVAAIAVLAGCSSQHRAAPSATAPSGQLTGTMSDWVNAVCERTTPPMPMQRGRIMGQATNPMVCRGLMQGNGVRVPLPISIGTYTSQSVMGHDLDQLGAYANGNDGTQYVVFGTIPTSAVAAEAAMLEPLRAYGFDVVPSPNSVSGASPSPRGDADGVPSPASTAPSPATGRQIPADADGQGFLSYPGAWCNYTNPAVVIARTADSALSNVKPVRGGTTTEASA